MHGLFFFIMRYHYEENSEPTKKFGLVYRCNHPVYSKCTLYLVRGKGLAVIRQYFDPEKKMTYWAELSTKLAADIYLHPDFETVFYKRSGACKDGLYPTVTVRQLMWALRMKPLPKKRWETVFDRKNI